MSLFEKFDKSKFLHSNEKDRYYIDDYLAWVHNEGLKRKKSNIFIPNPDDYMNENKIEITPGMRRQLALKEKELMGISFTPLFEEYEELRFIKCTHDLRDIEEMYLSNSSNKGCVIMVVPIKLEKRMSKANKPYYKLYCTDETLTKELYLSNKVNALNIVINEPLLLLIDVSNGSAWVQYFKHCIEADKVEIPCINIKANNHEDVRIISKAIMSNIGNTPVLINGKKHDLKVELSFKFKKMIQEYMWEILSENNGY